MTTIDMMTLISLFLNLILVFTSRQHNVGHLHRKKVGENKIVLMWSIYTQMGVILDVLARSGNNIFCQNCFKLFQNKLFFQNKLRHSDSSNKKIKTNFNPIPYSVTQSEILAYAGSPKLLQLNGRNEQ